MKEIKIALSGEKEEQIAQHIMKSVCSSGNKRTLFQNRTGCRRQ